jgi:hypothetical protein
MYRHSTGAGKTVMELEPIGKPAREVEALLQRFDSVIILSR